MMVVLNVLFLTIVCGVVYGVFLAAWVGGLFVFRVKHKLRYALISFPTFLAILLSLYVYAGRPSATFDRVLGFSPPPDVTSLQSSEWILGDSGVVYLRFKASPATIQRIVARGLLLVGPSNEPSTTSDSPPSWWQPPIMGAMAYYADFAGQRHGFASEDEYLIYDPATGEAYYRFVGID
jgi:hypothetical protein